MNGENGLNGMPMGGDEPGIMGQVPPVPPPYAPRVNLPPAPPAPPSPPPAPDPDTLWRMNQLEQAEQQVQRQQQSLQPYQFNHAIAQIRGQMGRLDPQGHYRKGSALRLQTPAQQQYSQGVLPDPRIPGMFWHAGRQGLAPFQLDFNKLPFQPRSRQEMEQAGLIQHFPEYGYSTIYDRQGRPHPFKHEKKQAEAEEAPPISQHFQEEVITDPSNPAVQWSRKRDGKGGVSWVRHEGKGQKDLEREAYHKRWDDAHKRKTVEQFDAEGKPTGKTRFPTPDEVEKEVDAEEAAWNRHQEKLNAPRYEAAGHAAAGLMPAAGGAAMPRPSGAGSVPETGRQAPAPSTPRTAAELERLMPGGEGPARMPSGEARADFQRRGEGAMSAEDEARLLAAEQ